MAQRLADPDGVELPLVAREEIAHLLGVELEELDLALPESEEPVGIFLRVGDLLVGLGLGQTLGYLDLLGGDGDAGHGAAELGGEVARGAAYAAADVEDPAALADARGVEEQADECDLGVFLGEGRLGLFCCPVAVMDVLAPFCVRLGVGKGG